MLRPTTHNLILQLRTLIGDQNPEEQVWSDDQLQANLDERKISVTYLVLTPNETYKPGGAETERLLYFAPCGNWELGAQLYDRNFNPITASQVNLESGEWVFVEDRPEPVYLTGSTFNLWAAAADTLESWAAQEKLSHDLVASGKDLKESQKFQMLLNLANQYRQKAGKWAGNSLSGRGDMSGAIGTGRWMRDDFNVCGPSRERRFRHGTW